MSGMRMIKNSLLLLLLSVVFSLAGCGSENAEGFLQEADEAGQIQAAENDLEESPKATGEENIVPIQAAENDLEESPKATGEENIAPSLKISSEEQTENLQEDEKAVRVLFEKFLNNEIAAYTETGELLFYRDLCNDNEEFYDPEPRFCDLDNDGCDEMIRMNGYGGKAYDARDGKVYLFAQGDGTARVLNHIDYDGNTWIYYCDVSHCGRAMFWFERYQGADCMAESFSLFDEFWEGEEHTYSLNEEEISMEEYKALYEEIFQQEYIPWNY